MTNRACRVVWIVVRTLLLAVGGLIGACFMLVFGTPGPARDPRQTGQRNDGSR